MSTKAAEFDNAMHLVLTRAITTVVELFTSEIEHAMGNNVGECEARWLFWSGRACLV